ncbi:D-isomer specific 2-hydroxyacid dehydrogenase family protein [Microbacterium sp. NPDC003461]
MSGQRGIPVLLRPLDVPEYHRAIVDGGGTLTDGQDARVLVWSEHGDPTGLAQTVREHPSLEWVQLPSAGIDNFASAGVLDGERVWTSAKGAYAKPVAEHALALTLAMLRSLQHRARARTWGSPVGKTLYGANVLIVGAGGIAQEFAALLAPFGVRITVCRRSAAPVGFAEKTIAQHELREHVADVDVLVLAAPLSAATRGIVDASVLTRMRSDAVVVNVGRGGLIATDALVAALAEERIAGAALDVTDPEPLPDGHPLWREPRALITPHSADTMAMIVPLLAERIAENLARFAAGQPLTGIVDVREGY